MNRRIYVQIGFILLLIVVGGLMSFWMVSNKKEPQQAPPEEISLSVEVAPAKKQQLNYFINTQGSVEPKLQTTLTAEVTGQVVFVSPTFVQGGFFSKGDILIRIDPSDYKTAVKTSEANLARARASLAEEKARAKVAEDEWNSLMKGDAPALYLRKPQLAGEIANLRSAEAEVERAKRDLMRTEIKAPYDGLVNKKSIDLGQFLPAGSELGIIFGTAVAEIRFPISEYDAKFLPLAQNTKDTLQIPVLLTDDPVNPTKNWRAEVVRDEGVINVESQVIYLVAEVNDPYLRKQPENRTVLKFGQFVAAQMQGNSVDDVVVLPRHLIRRNNKVLVAVDGELDIRDVVLERADSLYGYVTSGIDTGDMIVTTSIHSPLNGMTVETSEGEMLVKLPVSSSLKLSLSEE